MSGVLGGIGALASRGTQAFSGAQDIASGLGGLLGFGASGPVSLGPFVFASFEVPEHIAHGGAQQIIVHKLLGGGRVIDVTGRDDDPYEWSGQFLGPNAGTRSAQLEALRIAGRPLPLTFGSYSLRVVIASLKLETKQIGAHVRYRISVIVLSVNPATAGAPSALAGIAASIGQAAAVVQTGLAQVQQTVVGVAQLGGALGIRVPFLNAVQPALALAGGLAGSAAGAAITVPASVTGALAGVRVLTGGALASSGSALAGFNAAAPATGHAAAAAVAASGDAASAHAEAAATDAFAGQALAA